MSEQNTQEGSENIVQSMEKVVEKPHRKRSQEEKIGRQKYHEVLTKRLLALAEKIEETQRVILKGLKGAGYFRFSVPLLQRYACSDEVDVEIIDCVREGGFSGIFPKDVAARLKQYKLEYYDVSRRIVRMNKRLHIETGELLFEKRGHRWSLTKFAFEIYGSIDVEEVKTIATKERLKWR